MRLFPGWAQLCAVWSTQQKSLISFASQGWTFSAVGNTALFVGRGGLFSWACNFSGAGAGGDCFGHHWLLAVLRHFERGLFPLDQFAGVLAQFGARFVIEIKHVTAAVDF
jgi:hypothetical protein